MPKSHIGVLCQVSLPVENLDDQTCKTVDLIKRLDFSPRLKRIDESKLHVSLSKPFYLQGHEIELFSKKLEEVFKDNGKIEAVIDLNNFSIFENDQQDKFFMGTQVLDLPFSGKRKILQLINNTNNIMTQFNQPLFYTNPNPHISLATSPTLPTIPSPCPKHLHKLLFHALQLQHGATCLRIPL